MSGPILLDSGPLVALLLRQDQYHEWAIEHRSQIELPLLTCEPVLTEAAFLLARARYDHTAVIEFVRRGLLKIPFHLDDELESILALMKRYRDVPMSLADACLVRMAELHPGSRVFTIDSGFRRYRKNRRQAIPLLIPDDRR